MSAWCTASTRQSSFAPLESKSIKSRYVSKHTQYVPCPTVRLSGVTLTSANVRSICPNQKKSMCMRYMCNQPAQPGCWWQTQDIVFCCTADNFHWCISQSDTPWRHCHTHIHLCSVLFLSISFCFCLFLFQSGRFSSFYSTRILTFLLMHGLELTARYWRSLDPFPCPWIGLDIYPWKRKIGPSASVSSESDPSRRGVIILTYPSKSVVRESIQIASAHTWLLPNVWLSASLILLEPDVLMTSLLLLDWSIWCVQRNATSGLKTQYACKSWSILLNSYRWSEKERDQSAASCRTRWSTSALPFSEHLSLSL